MIALPPLEAGAVQETVACALPATAVTPVGAPGGEADGLALPGMNGSDAGRVAVSATSAA